MKGPHRAPASLARGPREKAYHQKVTVPVLQGRVCVCVCVGARGAGVNVCSAQPPDGLRPLPASTWQQVPAPRGFGADF